MHVLVCLDCILKYSSLNNRNFSQSYGDWRYKIRCHQDQCLVNENYFLGFQTATVLKCPHMVLVHAGGERDRQNKPSGISLLVRALIPLWESYPQDLIEPNYLQKAHLQILSHWGLSLQHMNWGQLIAIYFLAPKIHVLLICKIYSFYNNPQNLNLFHINSEVQSLT